MKVKQKIQNMMGKYEVGKDFFKDFCIMNMGSSLEQIIPFQTPDLYSY